jgi:hypothetical protein
MRPEVASEIIKKAVATWCKTAKATKPEEETRGAEFMGFIYFLGYFLLEATLKHRGVD